MICETPLSSLSLAILASTLRVGGNARALLALAAGASMAVKKNQNRNDSQIPQERIDAVAF
jgi:hypothetical protein